MTEAIDHREYNKFSNKSKNLIKKVQQLTVNATQLIPQLYDSLREDGISPLEARTYIEEIIVISQRQLRRILPDEAKHTEKLRTYDRKSNKPDIPPPPQVLSHDEVIKIVRERQNVEPKAIDEPIIIPTDHKQIMLDTGKFRSDLRIALINGAKVWLSYNNAKEVIKIDEKDNPQL